MHLHKLFKKICFELYLQVYMYIIQNYRKLEKTYQLFEECCDGMKF